MLLPAVKEAGAESVTTEFMCVEARADQRTVERYNAIGKVAGFDLWPFYRANSPQHGYKRLSHELKRPLLLAVRDETHRLGMRFLSSDNAGRDLCDGVNCCGVPPEWRSHTSHFGGAVLRAIQNGEVHFSEIQPEVDRLFNFIRGDADANSKDRARFLHATMAEYFRVMWNTPNSGKSLSESYGVLDPCELDSSGDVVYRPRRS
jgi:hypothetical protein